MKNALLVIDVQEYFISDSAKDIPGKIKDFIESHNFDFIFFFKFVNDTNSNWVKILKWSKMLKDEETEIDSELEPFLKEDNVFIKKTAFSVFSVDNFRKALKENKIKDLFICGLDTDACVYVSALEAFARGFDVKVVEDLCAASHGKEYHLTAIKLLEHNIGKSTVVNSEEIQKMK